MPHSRCARMAADRKGMAMEMVRIYRATGLRTSLRSRWQKAQMEAARVWTLCRDEQLSARQQWACWPNRDDLQQATKGRFVLHSQTVHQTVQMIGHAFPANSEATRELRKNNPKIRDTIRYPYKDKRHSPLYWPAQAV